MKNNDNCVNLGIESHPVNDWLLVFYGERSTSLTNEQVESIIRGLCLMDGLDFDEIVDKKRVKRLTVPIPVITDTERKKIVTQRKSIFLLGESLHYPHNCTLMRRNQILISIRQKCDEFGFEIADFDFGELPIIKQEQLAQRVFIPELPKIPVVVKVPERKNPPVIIDAEIKNDIEPVLTTVNTQPIGEPCPVCDPLNPKICGKGENNRFKTSPISGDKICKNCYNKQHSLLKMSNKKTDATILQ